MKNLRSNTMSKDDWAELERLDWSDFQPCPFCGKQEAELVLDLTHKLINPRMNNSKYPSFFVVECVHCDARAGMDLNPYKAIENWNKRVH